MHGRELGVSRNEGNWDVRLLVLRTSHSKPEATAFKFMDYYNRHAGCAGVPTAPILSITDGFFHFCDRSRA